MYRWAVRQLTRLTLARLRRGDPRLFLALAADDVHFRFPEAHSWAADHRSKEQLRRWLDRYRQARLELWAHDIVVNGPFDGRRGIPASV